MYAIGCSDAPLATRSMESNLTVRLVGLLRHRLREIPCAAHSPTEEHPAEGVAGPLGRLRDSPNTSSALF